MITVEFTQPFLSKLLTKHLKTINEYYLFREEVVNVDGRQVNEITITSESYNLAKEVHAFLHQLNTLAILGCEDKTKSSLRNHYKRPFRFKLVKVYITKKGQLKGRIRRRVQERLAVKHNAIRADYRKN